MAWTQLIKAAKGATDAVVHLDRVASQADISSQFISRNEANKKAVKSLQKKLEFLKDKLEESRENYDSNSDYASKRTLSVGTTNSIANDFAHLQGEIKHIADYVNKYGMEKFLSTDNDEKPIARELKEVSRIQQCLEQLQLISTSKIQILEEVQLLSDTLKKRTPESFDEFDKDLKHRFESLDQTLQNIIRLIQSIPHAGALSVNQGNSQHISNANNTIETKSIDEIEIHGITLFNQMSEDVSNLVYKLGQSGRPKEDVNDLIEKICNLWNGWQIKDSDIEYDKKRDGQRRKLGDGGTGIVYGGKFEYKDESNKLTPTNYPVAVKCIEYKGEDDASLRAFRASIFRQVFIHRSLDHPCIIRLYGLVWPKENLFNTKEYDQSSDRNGEDNDDDEDESTLTVSFVLERMTCDVSTALTRQKLKLRERADLFKILFDISSAVAYLHSKGIVHRDLKPENILLNVKSNRLVGNARLTDFGISRQQRDKQREATLAHNSITNIDGTPNYLPPEVVLQEKCRTEPSWDVWSFGLLMCVVLGEQSLRPKLSLISAREEAKSGELLKKVHSWANTISDTDLKKIAFECLSNKPGDRPKMKTVQQRIFEKL